jgi:hypothetical protein
MKQVIMACSFRRGDRGIMPPDGTPMLRAAPKLAAYACPWEKKHAMRETARRFRRNAFASRMKRAEYAFSRFPCGRESSKASQVVSFSGGQQAFRLIAAA